MFFNHSRKLSVVSSKWSVVSGRLKVAMGLCLSIFIYQPSASSQQLAASYKLLYKIPFQGGSFTTDNLQNLYLFHGNSIHKYNSQGQLQYNYSDKSYGAITSMDVNDPLKILVFYRDFPEIVLLDNTLSQNGNPFSPSDVGYPLSTLACTSHDNGIWLYDAQNFQLIRLDVTLNITQKTGNLPQAIGIPQLNPDYLMEYNNYVYLNDSAQGILVFDSYGTYYKTIPITGLNTFQVRGDDLYYTSKNCLHIFHLKTITEDVIKPPDTLATEVRVEKNMLFERYKDTVRVYEIK